MKIIVTGVGQTLNFETQKMEDVLHLKAENGKQLTIPISNESAKELIEAVVDTQRVCVNQRVDNQYSDQSDNYPEGAEIFGEIPNTGEILERTTDFSDIEVKKQKLLQKINNTTISRSRGVAARMSDRSGVPSRTLSLDMVDEMGNPIMAQAPADLMDDEDDPGEQI